MNIRKSISKDAIELELKSDDKDGVISELVDLMITTSKLKDRKAVLKLIHDREKKMSTGMNNGIAIPHAKTDLVDSVSAVIGIKKAGLDFESLDGEPAQIFIMTLSPAKRAGPHVQFLAEISRLLDIECNREKIMAAQSKEEVLDILSNGHGH
jgi:mannitol/fructose-specific phosphotransferase system IIA component (Ntr-type)